MYTIEQLEAMEAALSDEDGHVQFEGYNEIAKSGVLLLLQLLATMRELAAANAKIEAALAIPKGDTGYGFADECSNDMREQFRAKLLGETVHDGE